MFSIQSPTLIQKLQSLSVLKLLIVIAFIRALETPVLGKMIAAAWKV